MSTRVPGYPSKPVSSRAVSLQGHAVPGFPPTDYIPLPLGVERTAHLPTRREIQAALDQRQFTPFLQHIVDLQSGGVRGCEVLARWCHPTRGLVLPDVFIERAERFSLLNDLTCMLFETATSVQSSCPGITSVWLNISPSQLQDKKLVRVLWSIAERNHFPLSQLVLEVTEGASPLNWGAADCIHLIRKLGVRLAMDDYGVGHSDEGRLRQLPFDIIKLDASLTAGMLRSVHTRQKVQTILVRAREKGLETVAEGIEIREQADALGEYGCGLGQGWLFGRPQPCPRMTHTSII